MLLSSRSTSLSSQSSAFTFHHFRDSLATVTDRRALQSRLKPLKRADPVRAGIVALRLAELGVSPDYDLALSSFRSAAKNHPGDPEPWYGLGLAEQGRSRWEMHDKLRLGSRVGLRALERSADDYARALTADPRFIPAALNLAEVELMLLDSARVGGARDLLRRTAVSVHPAPPEFLLALGRLERAAGALDSAGAAFEAYLLVGPSRALGLLELARTRLALGRPDGEAAYYEGAALNDPTATAGYRADLELIAADSSLWRFDHLRGYGRATYLHQFWSSRDRLELRREGERLREHYRRIWFARAHFPLTISRRFYGQQDAYRSGSIEVDDRGVIYIRHGAPSRRIRPFIFGAMPNESWLYRRSDRDLVFHFSSGYDTNGGGDLYDYRLVQSVLDLRGAENASPDQLILSRQSLSPIYGRMLNWGSFGSAAAADRERAAGAGDIILGTSTDSYELQFAHPLEAVGDLVAVGRRAGARLAHFVFGIAGAGVTGQPRAGRMEYPVRVRLVALDRGDRAVASVDTTLVISLARELRPGEWLVGRAELTLPPGRWSYRAAVQQSDSSGAILPRDSVLVSPAERQSLGLSDIAMGSPGRAARWITAAEDTVLLAPSRLFRRGSEVQIYYELTGAAPGQVYRHRISVLEAKARRPRSEGRPLVSLSFDETAGGEEIRSRRSVQLDRLKPGSYLVEVKVTGPDGSSQTRLRPIQLIPTR